jgi:hypothetical protein
VIGTRPFTIHLAGLSTRKCLRRHGPSLLTRVEAAVVAVGRHASGPHEAWIAGDPFNGGFRVLITEPNGFERTVVLGIDEDPAVIAERVRETPEE